MWIEALGWLSALLLASTFGVQVRRLWRDGRPAPPRWLAAVQVLAATAFMYYCAAQRGLVFTLLSALLLIGASTGLAVLQGRTPRRRMNLPGPRGRVIWLASMNVRGRRAAGSLRATPWHAAPIPH